MPACKSDRWIERCETRKASACQRKESIAAYHWTAPDTNGGARHTLCHFLCFKRVHDPSLVKLERALSHSLVSVTVGIDSSISTIVSQCKRVNR